MPRSAGGARTDDAYAKVRLLAGPYIDPRTLTVDSTLRDLFHAYLQGLVTKGRRPWTLERYDAFLREFLAGPAGNSAIRDLDGAAIAAFLAWLRRRPGRRVGDRTAALGSGTANLRLVVLRGALRFAARLGLSPKLSPREIPLAPREATPAARPLTPPEIERVLGVHDGSDLDDLRARALIELLLATGCSVREAVGLDRTQLETDSGPGVVAERLTLYDRRGRPWSVALPRRARERLHRYLAARTDGSPALFHSRKADRNGVRRLQVRFAERIVSTALLRAGIAGASGPRDLARASASS